jgi:7,8-dihydropterin-6-yl-methyl-4-(beta-D-ribofuranosyl)aminobenzene 5'-phosphate synthase
LEARPALERPVRLRSVDSVEVTILVDNFLDIFLANSDHVSRPKLRYDWSQGKQLIAEHGYSILLTLRRGDEKRSLLYDTGLSSEAMLHNMEVLGLKLDPTEVLVMSHGHADHHGGLEGVLRRIGKRKLPVVLHPDAWKERKIIFPTGTEIHLPPPVRKTLEDNEVNLVEEKGPSLVVGDVALVSGQVERTTSFEKGFPVHYARHDNTWEKDPMVYDDQGIICNVKGKGLVVVSSCSHAGLVNVLRNAKSLTGIEKIHAFIGGLHLTGTIFEPIIPPTVAEISKIGPDFIVPGHCTGWKATHELARRLPQSYVQTGVGTRLEFS